MAGYLKRKSGHFNGFAGKTGGLSGSLSRRKQRYRKIFPAAA
ncbi:hypothetical protein HMPREF9371_1819 [Neisseria shayeganii 871]|uniref:Uncharacterized protein n=1 Tax=Neisseria shayeganii 871 TaxID=1032488 RepID=G4CJM9_9NEIS|nr:hypothetical protein HMPREF9371_1819 [Neisseria shayeganii 871]